MILSNVEILKALHEGTLVLDPRPAPEAPDPLAPDKCPYQTSAVDLSLDGSISWITPGQPITIDLRRGGFVPFYGANQERRTITHEEPYVLNPGKLVLAQTHEVVTLPIVEGKPVLAARIEGRSSFGRCGVQVHCTAPTIHAGYSGRITLELFNQGAYPVNLYKGMRICQLIVERVEGMPFRNDSQFQNQRQPGGQRS